MKAYLKPLFTFLLATGLAVACKDNGTDPNDNPTPTPTRNTIALVSDKDAPGNKDIYVLDTASHTETRLTTADAEDNYPSWSPDGTKIAFASKPVGGEWDIWVINADGTGLTQVTNNAAEDNYPSWSPDGSQIVFTSRRAGNSRIYKIDAASINESSAPVIVGDQPNGNDYYPCWSSNGKIVFASNREGDYRIYVMDPSGVTDTLKDISDTPVAGAYPTWSPDGTKIAFQSGGNIYKMDYTGSKVISNQTQLTTTSNNDDPSWSPDGTKIAFQSNRNGDNDVFMIEATSTADNPTNMTDLDNQNGNGINETTPAWWR